MIKINSLRVLLLRKKNATSNGNLYKKRTEKPVQLQVYQLLQAKCPIVSISLKMELSYDGPGN